MSAARRDNQKRSSFTVYPVLFLLTASAGHLPWIEDDYGKALAQAKAQRVPLFVEVWAPW